MVGGTYYAATGSIPGRVIAASIPFALLSTTVLMGKHIDKLPWDGPKKVGTLPVLLGERVARVITLAMMVGLLHRDRRARPVRRAARCTRSSRSPGCRVSSRCGARTSSRGPAEPPKGYPVWPLWYAPVAFVHSRRAGGAVPPRPGDRRGRSAASVSFVHKRTNALTLLGAGVSLRQAAAGRRRPHIHETTRRALRLIAARPVLVGLRWPRRLRPVRSRRRRARRARRETRARSAANATASPTAFAEADAQHDRTEEQIDETTAEISACEDGHRRAAGVSSRIASARRTGCAASGSSSSCSRPVVPRLQSPAREPAAADARRRGRDPAAAQEARELDLKERQLASQNARPRTTPGGLRGSRAADDRSACSRRTRSSAKYQGQLSREQIARLFSISRTTGGRDHPARRRARSTHRTSSRTPSARRAAAARGGTRATTSWRATGTPSGR